MWPEWVRGRVVQLAIAVVMGALGGGLSVQQAASAPTDTRHADVMRGLAVVQTQIADLEKRLDRSDAALAARLERIEHRLSPDR